MMKNGVIVFAKKPFMGRVKTRLSATLGAQKTYTIYCGLLRDLLERLPALDYSLLVFWQFFDVVLPFSMPADGIEEYAQHGANLGDIIVHAIETVAHRFDNVVIIGSDCPFVTQAMLRDVFVRLQTHDDVVVGPSMDGGYYLLGMRRGRMDLFANIAWSTDAVFAQTMAKIVKKKWRVSCLKRLPDIDTEEDLQHLKGDVIGL